MTFNDDDKKQIEDIIDRRIHKRLRDFQMKLNEANKRTHKEGKSDLDRMIAGDNTFMHIIKGGAYLGGNNVAMALYETLQELKEELTGEKS